MPALARRWAVACSPSCIGSTAASSGHVEEAWRALLTSTPSLMAIVGGSAIALLWLPSGDLRAIQCGAPSKPQPTTWNGRAGIWRLKFRFGWHVQRLRQRESSSHGRVPGLCITTVRSRYKRQLIRLNMKTKWPTRTGMGDSRPIFFCKRFSYNENALYNDAISRIQEGPRPRCPQAKSPSAQDGEVSCRPTSAAGVDLDARPCADLRQSCNANRQLIG